MAGADRKTISFTTDAGTEAEIKAYETRAGKENRSKAVEELVNIGLREQRGPMLYRWRDSAADVALMFCAAAVATLVIGMGTTLATIGQAIGVAGAFVAVALGLMAAVELGRTLRGQNELASVLRRVRQ